MKKLFILAQIVTLSIGLSFSQNIDLTIIPTGVNVNFNAVWASDFDQAFAVGPNGVFVKYDGHDAVIIPNSLTSNLNSVSGSSGGNVWAAGDCGAVIQYDGSELTVYNVGNVNLTDIKVYSYNDVWVCGPSGFISYWDGYNWNNISCPNLDFSQMPDVILNLGGPSMYFVSNNGTGSYILTYNGVSFAEILVDAIHRWYRAYSSDNRFFYLFDLSDIYTDVAHIYTYDVLSGVITEIYNSSYNAYYSFNNSELLIASNNGIIRFLDNSWNVINTEPNVRAISAPRNSHSRVYFAGDNGLLAYSCLDVGIKQENVLEKFVVYSDNNQLKIDLILSNNINCNKLDVINLGGKQVRPSIPFSSNKLQTTINIADLVPGVYFVRVISGEQSLVKKFILIK
jgi:hypothetical protein